MLSDCCIPSMMLVLGATLSKGEKDDAGHDGMLLCHTCFTLSFAMTCTFHVLRTLLQLSLN